MKCSTSPRQQRPDYRWATPSARELIYGLMLPSGTTPPAPLPSTWPAGGRSPVGVQEAVAAFAELMNQRARELNAATQFTVPDGYHGLSITPPLGLALIAGALEHLHLGWRPPAAMFPGLDRSPSPLGNTNQLVRLSICTSMPPASDRYTGQAGAAWWARRQGRSGIDRRGP